VITSAVVIEFSIVDESVNDDVVLLSTIVVSSEDECIDELDVVSISRERIVDVTEFVLVSVLIDDRTSDGRVLVKIDIDVRSSFMEVVDENI